MTIQAGLIHGHGSVFCKLLSGLVTLRYSQCFQLTTHSKPWLLKWNVRLLYIMTSPSLLIPTGGWVTLQAQGVDQKKTVCPPPCLVPPASEPPLSPLQRWTPRPSSKLCSSPPHSPPPPLSPPAHRPLPSASRYSPCLAWIHCLFINI